MRWLLAAVLVLCLAGCTPAAPTALDEVVAAEATPQAAGLVDLTIYYRHGRGEQSYLSPIKHEVPVSEDLPRTALRLLLDGPQGDTDGLMAPLPPTTEIISFAVQDQTAKVNLSRAVIDDAGIVGTRPEHEYLALAAIANTLTEFPAISRIALTVDGKRGGPFWGGWGLPKWLVRDDTVVDPVSPGRVVPDLSRFSAATQGVGGRRDSPAVISSIRARPRVGYLRVTLELTTPDGDPLMGPLPRTRVHRSGGSVELSMTAEAARGVIGDLATTFDDPTFTSASVQGRGQPPSVLVTVDPAPAGGFFLHTSIKPTRVILDIRR